MLLASLSLTTLMSSAMACEDSCLFFIIIFTISILSWMEFIYGPGLANGRTVRRSSSRRPAGQWAEQVDTDNEEDDGYEADDEQEETDNEEDDGYEGDDEQEE